MVLAIKTSQQNAQNNTLKWLSPQNSTYCQKSFVFSKTHLIVDQHSDLLCKTPSSWTRYIKLVKQNRLALKLKSRGGKPCAKALFFSSDRLSPRLIAVFQHSVLFQLAPSHLFPRVVPSLLMFISVFGRFFPLSSPASVVLLLNMTQEPNLLGIVDVARTWCPALSHIVWLALVLVVWGGRVATS